MVAVSMVVGNIILPMAAVIKWPVLFYLLLTPGVVVAIAALLLAGIVTGMSLALGKTTMRKALTVQSVALAVLLILFLWIFSNGL